MLACVALLDYVLGVVECQKLVKPRTEGLGDKCLTAGMMPAGAFVYVPEKGDAFLGCDASLEYTYRASLVKLSLNYSEGLGTAHDLSRMDSIFWQLAVQYVRKVWLYP
jgi:hypothetical protein